MITLILGVMVMAATVTTGEGKRTDSPHKEKVFETATFAGGCFWCMEPAFDRVEGVLSTTVGYTGGEERNPTYEEVCSGRTGHVEAMEVKYDPSRVGYEKLLDLFWRNIDPTQTGGQFADMGPQYRTVIFYHNASQRKLAEDSKKKLEDSGKFGKKKIATLLVPAREFYPAEEYHQDYYKKAPLRYKSYRWGSGRQGFLEEAWGKE